MSLALDAVAADSPGKGALDLTVPGGSWSLPATLLLPRSGEPAPCIVFFAGSGPTDRDWLSPLLPGTNGSGAQLATALQARGIGTLRFDKVGSGSNMKPLDVLSLEHYVAEAIAAYDLAAARPECGKIFFLGHSEGSIHATSAAVRKQSDPRFGGLISLSGPARPLIEVASEQIRARHERAGDDMAEVDRALAAFKVAVTATSEPSPPDLSRVPEAAALLAIVRNPEQPKVARELMLVDPLAGAVQFSGRALVVSAAHDAQVPKSDGDALFAALASSPDAKTRATIADANHVYKRETRDPRTLSTQDIMISYTEAGQPLADGIVDAIAAFASQEKPASK